MADESWTPEDTDRYEEAAVAAVHIRIHIYLYTYLSIYLPYRYSYKMIHVLLPKTSSDECQNVGDSTPGMCFQLWLQRSS